MRYVAIAAIAAFALGPALARLRLIPALGGLGLSMVGGLLGTVGLVLMAVQALRGAGTAPLWAFIAAGAPALAIVLSVVQVMRFPMINDVSTDADDPPQFVHALQLPANHGRAMGFPARSKASMAKYYPDLKPLRLDIPAAEAFERALECARQEAYWRITREDRDGFEFEGVAFTPLFLFHDDFIVRVRPQDGGAIVDMRSKSRDGKGDLGANAARIRLYFEKLQGE